MGELLSWHKVGQKVAVVDAALWKACILPSGEIRMAHPQETPRPGTVYTIADVVAGGCMIGFVLNEMQPDQVFNAAKFRPVYPSAIESLRKLEAPVSEPEFA